MNGNNKPSNSGMMMINRRTLITTTLLFVGVALSCLLLYKSAFPFQFLPLSTSGYNSPSPFRNSSASSKAPSSPSSKLNEFDLEEVLQNACMRDKTVIITTLNEAWAEPNSVFDVFLESFGIGEGTQKLMKHLMIVCFDQNAYARCLNLHTHCYALDTRGTNFSSQANFMTPEYFDMMWRRIQFLTSVLELGYNFVFTDADIMWLRDPFPRFYPQADFQIACDNFLGNSSDVKNQPNAGFKYVKSSDRTIKFYKFWYSSRQTYPGLNEQDVLNKIKYDPFLTNIGLQIRFLNTAYFGGFCERSKDFNKVCTMHANCCFGLGNKVHDLQLLLKDWRKFLSLPWIIKVLRLSSWSVPKYCK